MKAERTAQVIVVNLTSDEVLAVQAGKTVGDRPGVTLLDAKINVSPLSAVEPDDSLKDRWSIDIMKKALGAPLKGRLDTDGDLSVFVPAIMLRDVRISGGSIARESIETPGVEGRDRESFLRHAIPEKGVIVSFGGSLKVIDVGPTA